MKRRVAGKIQKKAKQKVLAGESLTPKERLIHNAYIENWLGNDIVQQIKQFGKEGK